MDQNKKIVESLYFLFEEANLQKSDDEVLEELRQNPDPSFSKNLAFIKKLNAKAKASVRRRTSTKGKLLLQNLINQVGQNELLDQLIAQPKYHSLRQLFSKHKNISDLDRQSALIDKKLMELVRELKAQIDDEENAN